MIDPPFDPSALSPELRAALGNQLLQLLSDRQSQPLFWRVADAVKATGLPRSTIYELAASKAIPALKLGNRVLIPRHKFLEWIDEQVCIAREEQR